MASRKYDIQVNGVVRASVVADDSEPGAVVDKRMIEALIDAGHTPGKDDNVQAVAAR